MRTAHCFHLNYFPASRCLFFLRLLSFSFYFVRRSAVFHCRVDRAYIRSEDKRKRRKRKASGGGARAGYNSAAFLLRGLFPSPPPVLFSLPSPYTNTNTNTHAFSPLSLYLLPSLSAGALEKEKRGHKGTSGDIKYVTQ